MNENRGCKFGGQFNVNKVPGNFHISTHSVSTKERFRVSWCRSGTASGRLPGTVEDRIWTSKSHLDMTSITWSKNYILAIRYLMSNFPVFKRILPEVRNEFSLVNRPSNENDRKFLIDQWERFKRDWKPLQHHMIIHWRLFQPSIKINLETPRNRLRRHKVATWTWAWSRDRHIP